MKYYISILTIIFTMIASMSLTVYAEYPSTAGFIDDVNFESPHNYPDNFNNTINISAPSNTTRMRVHFTKIETERFYDYVYTSAGDSWSGSLDNVWSSWVYSNSMSITLISDYSVTKWGYKIDKIEYFSQGATSDWKKTSYQGDTKWWYSNNEDYTKNFYVSGAKAIRVHFKELDTQKGKDFVYVSNSSNVYPDKLHGSRSNVWSSWFEGDSVTVNLQSDSSVTGRGYKIDKIQYLTNTDDFPWTNEQFDFVYPNEVNPDHGDGERRLSDRLNHMPSHGYLRFIQNAWTTHVYDSNVADRSFRLDFEWSKERLNNLVKDGNETYELEVEFYNYGVPTGTDLYGRPNSSFQPWMTTFGANDLLDDPNLIGQTSNQIYDYSIYDAEEYYDSVYYGFEQFDRGTYFYITNLPEESRYPDTMFPSNNPGNSMSFTIGISDCQYLEPNTDYYFEIIGKRNWNTDEGIFALKAQRGYNYDHSTLPNDKEYLVFNEESDEVSYNGNHVILFGYPNSYGNIDDSFKLSEIISMKDSRKHFRMFAYPNRTFNWNNDGRIIYQKETNGTWYTPNISRKWNSWNTWEYNQNLILGNYPENN
jgi:hypothetical protein